MPISNEIKAFTFYLVIALLLLALAPYSPEISQRWAFVPSLSDEYWRWFSAHFSHDSWTHWWTNFAAYVCFLLVFFRRLSWREIAALSIVLLLANALYLSVWYARDFYLGFSGLLFGWFIYASLRTLAEQTVLSVCILLYLTGKMVFAAVWPEQINPIEGLAVATEIHVLNSAIALCAFLSAGFVRHFRHSENDADKDTA